MPFPAGFRTFADLCHVKGTSMRTATPDSIDTYIAQFPHDIQTRLEQLRQTIRKAAPHAAETISYGMPAFKQHSVLVYFAAYAKHIGFYPTGSGIAAFQDEIAVYKNSKGAVQFPHDTPLPLALIRKMVQFRVKDDRARHAAK
jgi:uncharacterized protein YdhG (YjbR/CyaY superfamily)